MGTFSVNIEVGDQAGNSFRADEALVDTGATYTVLPAALLRELGVQPHRTSVFQLADGSQHAWEMGRTWVRIEGKQEMTLVGFGEDDARPRLGAVTMEEFLLAPYPIRRTLVSVPGLLKTLR